MVESAIWVDLSVNRLGVGCEIRRTFVQEPRAGATRSPRQRHWH